MKKILLCIASFSTAHNFTAQTLTCQSNCPKPGQTFSIKTASPVVAATGINQLWNFTKVYTTPGSYMISYLDPATVPAATLYPQANIVRSLSYIQPRFFHNDGFGLRSALASNSDFNVEPMELPLPFSYGNSYTQTVYSTQVVNGTDTINNTEIRKFNAVGTGTLILPGGTYNDVLYITLVTTFTSSYKGYVYGYFFSDNVKLFYSEKIPHPLVYSSQKHTTAPWDFGPNTEFISDMVLGIQDENMNGHVKLYPNPANTSVKIELSEFREGKIILTNSLGAHLKEINVTSEVSDFDLSDYPEGMYLLLFSGNQQTLTKKLVISR